MALPFYLKAFKFTQFRCCRVTDLTTCLLYEIVDFTSDLLKGGWGMKKGMFLGLSVFCVGGLN